MSIQLSDRVQKLGESATLKMARIAAELKAQGKNVINMSLGEPDFNTPDFIKQAAKIAIDENYSRYSPVPGFNDLRQAIASYINRTMKLDYSADEVVVSTGAKQSIANLLLALINPGDKVLLPAPYWVSYKDMLEFIGAEVVEVKTSVETDFKLTPKLLESYQDQYKMFLFSNPCNPTGALYNQDEINTLKPFFEKQSSMIIISDEIYNTIYFDQTPGSPANISSLKDRVVIVNGLSKGYAMTGWRLGYIVAPKLIAQACSKIQGQFTSGANSITQKAAIAAMNCSVDEMKYMQETFKKRRDLIFEALSKIEGIKLSKPQGAFYIFPDISSFYNKRFENHLIKDSISMSEYLLEQFELALTPGAPFGADECIRLSYATDELSIIEAVRRIEAALKQLI